MAVINLEKFNPKKTVKLDDKEYTVNLFTVGDFISGKAERVLPNDEKATTKDFAEAMVKFIAEYSDIPQEVLLKQGMGMLQALTVIIQGGDPEAVEDGGKGNA